MVEFVLNDNHDNLFGRNKGTGATKVNPDDKIKYNIGKLVKNYRRV